MNIRIIDANSNDVYDNWQIQQACWLDNFIRQERGISKEDILDWFDETKTDNKKKLLGRAEKVNKDPDKHLWVAKDGDRTIGFVAAKRGRRNELDGLFVLPEYQGKGVGSSLIRRVLSWVGMDKRVHVNVVSGNVNAIDFYKRFGFLETNKEIDSGVIFASGASFTNIEMVRN